MLFLGDPFGLRFRALIMFAGIEEAAVPAAVQVGVTVATGVLARDFLLGKKLNRRAAAVAVDGDIAHNTCRILQKMRQFNDSGMTSRETFPTGRSLPGHGAAVARCALAMALVVLCLGCGGKIPPTHYYVLDLPPAPSPTSEALPGAAVVMPFRASRMLIQDRIVYRPAQGEVGFYEYHRWAEDPRDSLTKSLIQHLRSRGAFSSVVAFDGRSKTDYIIRGTLERLEEVDSGGVAVYVKISAQLMSSEARETVWQGEGEGRGQVTAGEVRSVVAEMSRASHQAIKGLADQINEFVRSKTTAAQQ